MDVQKKLDEIVAALEGARSMPMSASCVINRGQLLGMLSAVRDALPASLSEAEGLLGDRERVLEQAQADADRIIESAHQHHGSLVADTEIARSSQAEADRILGEARREAEEIRAEADDYVDSKLANFEVVLTKTLGSVERGRDKLLGRGQDDDGFGPTGLEDPDDPDGETPERSSDPEELRRRADRYVDVKLGAFEAVLAKTLEAVGRGRQKLTGHRPTDDLGAHLAAQDAVDGSGQGPRSDADFLADLAAVTAQPLPEPVMPQPLAAALPQQPVAPEPAPYDYQQPQEYAQAGMQAGVQTGMPAGMAYPGEQAAGYPVGSYPEQAGYDGYGYPQQPQGYADPAAGYGWQQPMDGYGSPGLPEQQPYLQPVAGLDETSFFDTSMLDMEALRQADQGR